MYLMGGKTGYCISKSRVVFPTRPRLSWLSEEAKSGHLMLILSRSVPPASQDQIAIVFLVGGQPAHRGPPPLGLVALPKRWDCSPKKAPNLPLEKVGAPPSSVGNAHPTPSSVCSSFLNQSVNL